MKFSYMKCCVKHVDSAFDEQGMRLFYIAFYESIFYILKLL